MLVIFGFGVLFLLFKLLLDLYLLFLMFSVFVFGFVLVTLCASVLQPTSIVPFPPLSPSGGRCWFILGAQIFSVPLWLMLPLCAAI
jgi:hypothetical protein